MRHCSMSHIHNTSLQVSIVAMSGAVGEALKYEVATGGAADLDNLGQIMGQTNPPMDGPAQQSQARWVLRLGLFTLSGSSACRRK